MQHLDKTVQNNAAAEEMSSMSENMEHQSIKLQQTINYFRFEDSLENIEDETTVPLLPDSNESN